MRDGKPVPNLPPPSDGPPATDIEVDLDAMSLPGPPATGVSPVPTGPAALPAICMFGRYEILGRLAFGGMAEIFLARESSSVGASRHVVIKRVLPNVADDEKFVEMFLNEARLAIQLSHPNICHINEFGELEGSYFIAMEWVDGVPLGKLIRRARKKGNGVPVEIAVRIGAQIAEALYYAHRAKDALRRPMNIVHRDVTPHNIMVAYDGQVKLLDFGIAKAETQTQKTEAGTVKGKFSYMSPEQCTGKEIDGRSDVFALGICLWESLVGKALYRRETQYETMHAVIHEPPATMRKRRADLPASLDAIVLKALAKEPGERYQNAGELQSALEGWLAENRKVVNSSSVAKLMDELYAGEIQRGPLVDSNPFGSSFQTLGGSASMPGAAHASGSMSAAMQLSQSQLSAQSQLGTLPKSNVPKYAALAVAALIGLAAAVFSIDTSTDEPDSDAGVAVADPEGLSDQGIDTAPAADGGEGPTEVDAEEPPPAATHALVVVTYSPARARVELDGNLVSGDSPLLIDALDPGEHRVTVTAPRHRPFEEELELGAGERVDVVANLRPLPRGPTTPPGRLSINTRPWSKVYVGSRLLGTTPIANARVSSGAVRLRLVDRDGRSHTKSVRVPANGSESVFYNLNR